MRTGNIFICRRGNVYTLSCRTRIIARDKYYVFIMYCWKVFYWRYPLYAVPFRKNFNRSRCELYKLSCGQKGK